MSSPAQKRRDRALISATLPRLVTRALMRRLWVRASPSGRRTVATMLDVIVKTSTCSNPQTCSSRWMVSSTRLTSAPYASSSSPASRAQVKHSAGCGRLYVSFLSMILFRSHFFTPRAQRPRIDASSTATCISVSIIIPVVVTRVNSIVQIFLLFIIKGEFSFFQCTNIIIRPEHLQKK